jgi:hypothetical protein
MIMNDEYVRIWKEAVAAYFKVPSQNLPGKVQEKLVAQLIIEPCTSTVLPLHQSA